MKLKDAITYMSIAKLVSVRSYATRLKVGCAIEKGGSIISTGWNGMPANYDNACEHKDEHGCLVTNKEVQHAELNAIGKAAKSGISTENANLFITHSPCMNCALLINVAGIKSVYFESLYRDSDGIDFLLKNNINVYMVDLKKESVYAYTK